MKILTILLFNLLLISESEKVEMSMYVETSEGVYEKVASKMIASNLDEEATSALLAEAFSAQIAEAQGKYFIANFQESEFGSIITQEDFVKICMCCWGVNKKKTERYCDDFGICNEGPIKRCKSSKFTLYFSCSMGIR